MVDPETGEVGYHRAPTKGVLSFAGRVVDCKPVLVDQKAIGGGVRSDIKCWSAASRRRLLFYMASLDFKRVASRWGGRFAFVTLTWRDDPGPDEVRRQRNHFLQRLGDRLGARRWVWKLEFQRRGAPHLHLLVWTPFVSDVELSDFRRWTWDAWDDVSGGYVSESGVRGLHRTDVDWCRAKDVARYIAFDLTKSSKGYQFTVPETWSHTGRWWGTSGLVAEWLHVPLAVSEVISVRRMLRRYRQANSTGKARFGRCKGLSRIWVIGREAGTLVEAIDRYLTGLSPGDNLEGRRLRDMSV
ncbi:MAG: hypothetical protein GEU78_16100 [Actinobacteria bacterium]|nr:hypothetical protein [Actinomycetota bacterium]